MGMKNRELKAASMEDSHAVDDSSTSLLSDEEVPSTTRPLSTTDTKLAAEDESESEEESKSEEEEEEEAEDESESEEESKPEEEDEEEDEEEVPKPTAAQRKATMPAAESDSLPAPISKPNPTAAQKKTTMAAAESTPKPLDNVSNLKTQKFNQNPKPVVIAADATVKRALPLDDTEESKSKKKAKNEEVEGIAAEEGRKLLLRLWGEDDEITLLQGMVDYKEEKGTDPIYDKADFYDFVNESLHVDVDKNQVAEKVRKLKKKHLNNMKKSLTPASKISKLIWGKPITTTNNKPATDNDNGLLFIGKSCVKMGLDEEFVKLGLSRCSDQSKREIDEEWKQLILEEAALLTKRLKLTCKENKLITDALNVE